MKKLLLTIITVTLHFAVSTSAGAAECNKWERELPKQCQTEGIPCLGNLKMRSGFAGVIIDTKTKCYFTIPSIYINNLLMLNGFISVPVESLNPKQKREKDVI